MSPFSAVVHRICTLCILAVVESRVAAALREDAPMAALMLYIVGTVILIVLTAYFVSPLLVNYLNGVFP
jgi:hypothetical protein